MSAVADLPEIDFTANAYRTNPFPVLADFARKWKVARSKRGVEVLDYALCRSAIVDRRLGTGHPKLMEVLGLPEGDALDYKRNSISFHNRSPTRRRLRAPILRFLGQEATERFRADVRMVVAEAADSLPTNQPIDLIQGFCDQIPSGVYCRWVDAPLSDSEFVGRTSHIVQQVHTRDPSRTEQIVEGFDRLIEYIDERIRDVRSKPGDNLISDLVRASDNGELSPRELRDWLVKLAEANTDNTSHQIGIAIIDLASRPEVWAELGRQPDLAPAAVREVMRFRPRSISTSREALAEMEIGGCPVPAGTPVFANFGAAHWDPRFYPEPERFDVRRPRNPEHLNFGGGIFSCVGRFIATMETEEAVAHLARRFPKLVLDQAEFEYSPMFTSVAKLTATLDPTQPQPSGHPARR